MSILHAALPREYQILNYHKNCHRCVRESWAAPPLQVVRHTRDPDHRLLFSLQAVELHWEISQRRRRVCVEFHFSGQGKQSMPTTSSLSSPLRVCLSFSKSPSHGQVTRMSLGTGVRSYVRRGRGGVRGDVRRRGRGASARARAWVWAPVPRRRNGDGRSALREIFAVLLLARAPMIRLV